MFNLTKKSDNEALAEAASVYFEELNKTKDTRLAIKKLGNALANLAVKEKDFLKKIPNLAEEIMQWDFHKLTGNHNQDRRLVIGFVNTVYSTYVNPDVYGNMFNFDQSNNLDKIIEEHFP